MKILFTFFVLFFSSSVVAETVNLKCDIESPYASKNIDASINIEKGLMQFGWLKYNITFVTDDNITGLQTTEFKEVGHDVWVLDRNNGTFFRAYVGLVCADDTCKKKKLYASTFEGKCTKKLL
jgi:hypothetical protein